MRRPIHLLLGATLLAATVGCASSPNAAGAAGARASRTSSGPNALSAADITAATQENLRDVIGALRPRWLQNTSAGSLSAGGANAAVLVFVNGQAAGGIDALGSIAKASVERINYYSVSEAQSRFGSRVRGPVIDVRLRTGG